LTTPLHAAQPIGEHSWPIREEMTHLKKGWVTYKIGAQPSRSETSFGEKRLQEKGVNWWGEKEKSGPYAH